MANYTGQEYIPQPIRQDENFQLWTQVAAMKQQKYDQYQAQINSVASSLLNTDLLRDSDRNYLSDKYQEMASKINQYSNQDITNPNIKKDIDMTMMALANDSRIQSAVLNAKKYRTFEQEIETLKKDNKAAYSDVNLQDSLDQAGFSDYLSGRTDNLGEFKYHNYTDVIGKLNKEAKDYADLMGKEQYLDSEKNQYYVVDNYGRKVSVSDVKNHLANVLNADDMKQLEINARQTIGKQPQAAIAASMSPILLQKINSNKELKAQYEAEMSSTSDPDKKAALKDGINNIDVAIKNYQAQIDTNTFNIEGIYKESVLNQIASDYDINVITNKKVDDMNFQMFKFATEQNWKQKEYDLKLAELQLKQKELNPDAQPTQIENTNETAAKVPVEDELRNSFKTADLQLDSYLKNENPDNYNQKTPQQQFAYKMSLRADDPTAESYSLEKQNLIRAFRNSQTGYAKVVNDNTQTFISTAGQAYNTITGANLNNLKAELPITSYYKQQGKSFEDLDKNVQKAITLEMGNNWNERASISDRESKILVSSLYSLQAQLEQHPSQKVKNLVAAFKSGQQRTSVISKLSTKGGAAYNLNSWAIGGTLFKEDTDLTELEKYTGDASQDITEIFKSGLQKIVEETDKKANIANKNLVSNKSMGFSTQNKMQKADAEQLQAVIIASGAAQGIPSNTNNYIVSKQGEGYRIQYQTGTEAKPKIAEAYVSKLPEGLASRLNLAEADWNASYLNPMIALPKYEFKRTTKDVMARKISQLSDKRPDIVSPTTLAAIYNGGSLKGTNFQSDEDFLENAQADPRYNTQLQPAIENILNAKYSTELQVKNGQLLGSIDIIFPDGKKDKRLVVSKTNKMDEGALYYEMLNEVAQYKQQKINAILSVNGNK